MSTSTTFLSGVETTSQGYLLFPDHPDQAEKPLLVLESVEQLWLRLHPLATKLEETPLTALSLQELQHFGEFANKVVPVLEDIDRMRDRGRFLSKHEREQRDERIRQANSGEEKISSLKRQQEAHLRQESITNGDDYDTDSDRNVHATLRMVKTLNSIRLLYPLLLSMLHHESALDKTLVMSGGKNHKLEGKHERKLFLLGNQVYDIVTPKNITSLQRQMRLNLTLLLSPQEVNDLMSGTFTDWPIFLPKLLSKAQTPMAVPNPLSLLNLTPPQLERARQHDEAVLSSIRSRRDDDATHELFLQAVSKLQQTLQSILEKRFRSCRLQVYGSCLSDLSLGKTSDVDISIHIPRLQEAKLQFEQGKLDAHKYDVEIKKHVFSVCNRLGDFKDDFSSLQAVPRARVPVVKGRYQHAGNPHSEDGSLCFDICFFNDIAVQNSTLLRNYTEVHERCKDCMLLVKYWAKQQKISSAADERLSSYAWVTLAIYYLQQIHLLPNLQCPELMNEVGFEIQNSDPLHCINALNTAFVPWMTAQEAWKPGQDAASIPVSILLYGFLHFLNCAFPMAFYAISMRTTVGKPLVPKSASKNVNFSFWCIEDPFETFETHYPHDLTSPVSEKGRGLILKAVEKSEVHLRSVLTGDIEVQDGKLWELESVDSIKEIEQTKSHQPVAKDAKDKKQAEKRRNRKKKQSASQKLVKESKGSETNQVAPVENIHRKKAGKAPSTGEKNGDKEQNTETSGVSSVKIAKKHTESHQPVDKNAKDMEHGKKRRNRKSKQSASEEHVKESKASETNHVPPEENIHKEKAGKSPSAGEKNGDKEQNTETSGVSSTKKANKARSRVPPWFRHRRGKKDEEKTKKKVGAQRSDCETIANGQG